MYRPISSSFIYVRRQPNKRKEKIARESKISVTRVHAILKCKNKIQSYVAINFKKSCCIRIGPRCDKTTGTLYSETGHSIPWVTEMRYFDIYFVQSRKLKCSLDAAKRGFYRAANSIFSKIGRTASEEVILQIISNFQANVCQS